MEEKQGVTSPELGRRIFSPVQNSVPFYPQGDVPQLVKGTLDGSKAPGSGTVHTTLAVSQGAFAAPAPGHALELHGIQEGDILTCEPAVVQKPSLGDVVLYIQRDSEELHLGIYQDPWLVHHTVPERPAAKVEDVEVLAIAIEVRRSLRRQA